MGYIYCITNLVNGKQYVGKTTYSITKRFQEHCKDCAKIETEQRPLYSAMNKYGKESFIVEKLMECDNEELDSYEILYIDKLNTYHNGYNATKGGDGKPLFDYKQILEVYLQKQSVLQTAQKVGCCVDTVRNVLHTYKIPTRALTKQSIYEQGLKSCLNIKKEVVQLDMHNKEIQQFESIAEAAHWLVNNGYAKQYNGGVRQKISNVCQGKLKTAYQFKWKLKSKQLHLAK